MQTLNLNAKNIVETQPFFWEKHLYMKPTEGQLVFDWLFGIIFPFCYLLFDYFVIQPSPNEGSIFGTIKPFVYLVHFALIIAASAFLVFGKKLKWMNGFLVGVFFVGGAIYFVIGVLLLPFTIIGLFFVVGILGFIPLCIAFAYLRNAVRAYEFAKSVADKRILLQAALISALFVFIVPLFLIIHIENKKSEMLTGSVQTIRKNAKYLYWFSPITDFESLDVQNVQQISNERKEALAVAYEELTGEKLDRKKHTNFY